MLRIVGRIDFAAVSDLAVAIAPAGLAPAEIASAVRATRAGDTGQIAGVSARSTVPEIDRNVHLATVGLDAAVAIRKAGVALDFAIRAYASHAAVGVRGSAIVVARSAVRGIRVGVGLTTVRGIFIAVRPAGIASDDGTTA